MATFTTTVALRACALLCLCAAAASSRAEEERAPDVWVASHEALSRDVAAPDRLALLSAPIPLPFWADTLNDQAVRSDFETFGDGKFTANWIALRTDRNVGSAYWDLTGSVEFGRTPFTPQQAERFSELENELFVPGSAGTLAPSEKYERYLTLKSALDAAQADWDRTPADQRTLELRQRLLRAREELEVRGEGVRLSADIAELRRLYSLDYSKSIPPVINGSMPADGTALQSRLERQLRPFYERSWRVAEATIRVHDSARAVPYGFSAASLASQLYRCDTGEALDVDLPAQITVRFSWTRIPLARPWLRLDQFARPVWRFSTPGRGERFGGAFEKLDQTPGSPLTNPVNGVVIAAGLYLTANWTTDHIRWFESRQSATEPVCLGPFVLAGTRDSSFGRVTTRAYPVDGRSVLVPGVQLIGVTFAMRNAAPLPDAGLLWNEPLKNLPFRN